MQAPAVAQPDRHDLSAAQLRVWFDMELHPETTLYNTADCIEIEGQVDHGLLAAAIREAVDSSAALRVRFGRRGGAPVQYVDDEVSFTVPFVDLSRNANPRAAALEWMESERLRPYDLERGPLFRFALLQLSSQRFLWMTAGHHLILDAVGWAEVAREVSRRYRASSKRAGCSPRKDEFLDVMNRAAQYPGSPAMAADREYWLAARLQDVSPVSLAVRCDSRRESGDYHRAQFEMDASLSAEIRATADRLGVTTASLLIAACVLYLHRITGAARIPIGVDRKSVV